MVRIKILLLYFTDLEKKFKILYETTNDHNQPVLQRIHLNL